MLNPHLCCRGRSGLQEQMIRRTTFEWFVLSAFWCRGNICLNTNKIHWLQTVHTYLNGHFPFPIGDGVSLLSSAFSNICRAKAYLTIKFKWALSPLDFRQTLLLNEHSWDHRLYGFIQWTISLAKNIGWSGIKAQRLQCFFGMSWLGW